MADQSIVMVSSVTTQEDKVHRFYSDEPPLIMWGQDWKMYFRCIGTDITENLEDYNKLFIAEGGPYISVI